jgi:hypothetical protein
VVAPPNAFDFHQLLRESLLRPWMKRGPVLAIALLQAIPAALSTVITEKAVKGLGPPFEPGAVPAEGDLAVVLDQLTAALEPYSRPLFVSFVLGIVLTNVAAVVCTALFAGEPPPGGIGATAVRRFLPVLLTNLVVALLTGVAALACCLPAIPMSAALTLAVPLVVLGGVAPFAAIRRSIAEILPQLWVVVGVDVMLWSLLLGGGMVVGAIGTPMQLAFGTPGMIVSAALSAYLGAVLGMPRLALGVVIVERLQSAPAGEPPSGAAGPS